MKTPIKNLEEAIVYLGKILKVQDIGESAMSNLNKAVAAIEKAHDILLIEELAKTTPETDRKPEEQLSDAISLLHKILANAEEGPAWIREAILRSSVRL
jgi:hypothetical protein